MSCLPPGGAQVLSILTSTLLNPKVHDATWMNSDSNPFQSSPTAVARWKTVIQSATQWHQQPNEQTRANFITKLNPLAPELSEYLSHCLPPPPHRTFTAYVSPLVYGLILQVSSTIINASEPWKNGFVSADPPISDDRAITKLLPNISDYLDDIEPYLKLQEVVHVCQSEWNQLKRVRNLSRSLIQPAIKATTAVMHLLLVLGLDPLEIIAPESNRTPSFHELVSYFSVYFSALQLFHGDGNPEPEAILEAIRGQCFPLVALFTHHLSTTTALASRRVSHLPLDDAQSHASAASASNSTAAPAATPAGPIDFSRTFGRCALGSFRPYDRLVRVHQLLGRYDVQSISSLKALQILSWWSHCSPTDLTMYSRCIWKSLSPGHLFESGETVNDAPTSLITILTQLQPPGTLKDLTKTFPPQLLTFLNSTRLHSLNGSSATFLLGLKELMHRTSWPYIYLSLMAHWQAAIVSELVFLGGSRLLEQAVSEKEVKAILFPDASPSDLVSSSSASPHWSYLTLMRLEFAGTLSSSSSSSSLDLSFAYHQLSSEEKAEFESTKKRTPPLNQFQTFCEAHQHVEKEIKKYEQLKLQLSTTSSTSSPPPPQRPYISPTHRRLLAFLRIRPRLMKYGYQALESSATHDQTTSYGPFFNSFVSHGDGSGSSSELDESGITPLPFYYAQYFLPHSYAPQLVGCLHGLKRRDLRIRWLEHLFQSRPDHCFIGITKEIVRHHLAEMI